MSTVATNGSKEKLHVFETILSSPGMQEKCKILLQLSRREILLLGRLIEAGLLKENGGFGDEILAAIPKESVEALRNIHEELLKKGEMTEFYQRLKLL